MSLRLFIILFFMCMPLSLASAEVYRWLDAEGNVHFGDKKPEHLKADDISREVSETNIDESSANIEKLGNILLESEGEKQLKAKKEYSEQQNQRQKKQACNNARKQLRILNGRVSFVDDNGKSYDISEQQRKIEATKLEAEIHKRCK
ncbi:MAG: DUF4124 domain-containing protein [Pseudomonadales bacterium]|nr:DUF4124 domain-containing protein [Pseudomonadales bacterium]